MWAEAATLLFLFIRLFQKILPFTARHPGILRCRLRLGELSVPTAPQSSPPRHIQTPPDWLAHLADDSSKPLCGIFNQPLYLGVADSIICVLNRAARPQISPVSHCCLFSESGSSSSFPEARLTSQVSTAAATSCVG